MGDEQHSPETNGMPPQAPPRMDDDPALPPSRQSSSEGMEMRCDEPRLHASLYVQPNAARRTWLQSKRRVHPIRIV
jgi:hypothetical protein